MVFQEDPENGRIGLLIYPAALAAKRVPRRETLAGRTEFASHAGAKDHPQMVAFGGVFWFSELAFLRHGLIKKYSVGI